jgi:uncharacterized protein
MREPTGATVESEVSADRVPLAAGAEVTDVEARVRLLRTNRGILASVTAQFTVSLACARCLAPLSARLSVQFEDEYLPVIDVVTGAPVHFDDEADALRIDEHHILDLTEAVRQYGVAAEPMAPLCRVDCRGLCPHCGADLNLTQCQCAQPADPRWSALESLAEPETQTTDEDA